MLKVQKVIDNYDAVVFIGDYADDWGKEPQDTIDTWKMLRMLHMSYKDKIKLIIGNHDYAYLLNYIPNSSGFNPTTKLLLNTPENRQLLEWLSKIPITLEIDNVTYSHAGLSQEWEDDMPLWSDISPLWLRPDIAYYQKIPQVFGHTPTETCRELELNIWCIDTHSTYRDGTPIGDKTVLEIIDGKEFNIIKLEE